MYNVHAHINGAFKKKKKKKSECELRIYDSRSTGLVMLRFCSVVEKVK